MKFKMNNHEWEIKEIDSETILEEYKKIEPSAYFCFGLSSFPSQVILLNSEVHKDKKKKTLYHELMHVYIYEYCSRDIELDEEIICDISANSHNIIHDIVEKYFNETKIETNREFNSYEFVKKIEEQSKKEIKVYV